MGIENQVKTREEAVIYKKRKFNKKHFFFVMAILLGIYLLAIGFVWIGKITNVVDLEYFKCTSKDKGKYIKGDITCRTKVLPATVDGYEKEGWYYFMVPCGKEGKYIVVYADENQYEQFKNLPEINPSKEQKQETKTVVSLTGKIIKISSPVYEDFKEMLGIIGEESTTDDKEDKIQKAKTEEEKLEEREKEELEREQKMEEMTNIQIAVKLMDARKEQTRNVWIVTLVWFVVVLGVMYRTRKWVWEVERREDRL